MTPRIGVDVVAVARIAGLLGPEPTSAPAAVVNKIWTPGEWADSHRGGRPSVDSLAGRWAAKEAVLKVIRVGVDEIPLTDIEITMAGRAPNVHLLGRAGQRAAAEGLAGWSVSISHDAGVAVAGAIALEMG